MLLFILGICIVYSFWLPLFRFCYKFLKKTGLGFTANRIFCVFSLFVLPVLLFCFVYVFFYMFFSICVVLVFLVVLFVVLFVYIYICIYVYVCVFFVLLLVVHIFSTISFAGFHLFVMHL